MFQTHAKIWSLNVNWTLIQASTSGILAATLTLRWKCLTSKMSCKRNIRFIVSIWCCKVAEIRVKVSIQTNRFRRYMDKQVNIWASHSVIPPKITKWSMFLRQLASTKSSKFSGWVIRKSIWWNIATIKMRLSTSRY